MTPPFTFLLPVAEADWELPVPAVMLISRSQEKGGPSMDPDSSRGEDWRGHRVIEVEGPARVSPNDLAKAFSKALERPVRAKIAPRDEWEAVFRAPGHDEPEAARANGRRLQRRLDRICRRRRQLPVHILYSGARQLSPRLRVFIDWAAERYRGVSAG